MGRSFKIRPMVSGRSPGGDPRGLAERALRPGPPPRGPGRIVAAPGRPEGACNARRAEVVLVNGRFVPDVQGGREFGDTIPN